MITDSAVWIITHGCRVVSHSPGQVKHLEVSGLQRERGRPAALRSAAPPEREEREPSGRYLSGENADGITIFVSWVMSRPPPPGGGHTPFFRASSRICIRWSRLE